jgi:hypothetical protein
MLGVAGLVEAGPKCVLGVAGLVEAGPKVERVALNTLAWALGVAGLGAAAQAIRSSGLGASRSTSIPGISDPSYTDRSFGTQEIGCLV